MPEVSFTEPYSKQPYFRVLVDGSVVYQSKYRKPAYDFYLWVKNEFRKEEEAKNER